MKGFLDYKDCDSVFHRLNPITKIIISVLICVGCFACNNLIVLCFFPIFDLILSSFGKILPETARMLKGLLKVSIFIFVLQLIFVRDGEAVKFIPFITYKGLETAASVVLKLIGATLPLASMLKITKLNDLSNVMVVKMHIPYKYAFAVTQSIHFIPCFMNDMYDIMEAQKARGVDFDTKNVFRKIGLIVPLCVPLLISSVKKTNSAAVAAKLRGFELRTRERCFYVPSFSVIDVLFLFAGAAVATVGIMF